jgi:ribonuclease HI
MIIYTDGASRGNPGAASGGFTIDGVPYAVRFSGERTNNEAEYLALIHALRVASAAGTPMIDTRVDVYMDSLLVVKQVNGEWAINSLALQHLHQQTIELLRHRFHSWQFTHVTRDKNGEADRLANLALDERRLAFDTPTKIEVMR